ncbi:MobF family relaxase [Burkholderia cenocepacia]|uniref:MobF family relaxase n=1 Tax=Burkholderia cenocepacia TaxID=95486 RepID=UPI00234BF079|nr:MobF family relaxase [Burkholderia cenocepacia]MDC6085925.1 relaxase domain-containing protein [Burkholderia cenocepacia]
MISKEPIRSVADAARYHDKSFNKDAGKKADNYYVNEKATAHWQGRGADFLGIRGKAVTKEEFIQFLSGRMPHPDTGKIQNLANNSKGDKRRAGIDFTIAPPKSVSIAGLVGRDDRVIAAHLAANARTMEWFEKHASLIRVKDEKGRNRPEVAGNLLYATVLHETNRENEPQLHNHNVIVSAVYDGARHSWRSLTNDLLYTLRARGDIIYKAELAAALRHLGYQLEYAENGIDFELKGFSRDHVDTFSTRAVQVREALLKHGIDPGEASFDARRVAKLDSRAAKQEHPREILQSVWEETAKEANLDVASIVERAREAFADRQVTRRGVERTVEREAAMGQDSGPSQGAAVSVSNDARATALRAVSWAIEHLTEREQAFTLVDLEVTALKFSRGSISEIEWAIDQHVRNHMLVDRGITVGGQIQYTTHKAIDSELKLVEHILAGRGQGNVVLDAEDQFDAAVAAFEAKKTAEIGEQFKLSGEQIQAARNVLMHEDSIQGIQGEAGTGKTAALAMVKDVAQALGWEVIGVATSAAAATELEASSGIQSDTVAGYFAKRDSAIRAVELRLQELRKSISERATLRGLDDQRIEARTLAVKSEDIDYGTHRYTFDHQRGEVFRSPENLRNAIGAALSEIAARHREAAGAERGHPVTLGEQARETVRAAAANVAASLGRRLMTFEQIGTAEAVAARNTLYLERQGSATELDAEYARTQAKLENLRRYGNVDGKKTLIVMDESSLTGVDDTEKLLRFAREIGARTVLQGDVKQHGSVAAGRAFEQAQIAGMNVSILEETRRFRDATAQTRQALADMKAGNYAQAIARLDTLRVAESDLAKTVAERYLENLQELTAKGVDAPKVGVVAITNSDRKSINAAVHQALSDVGIISGPHFEKPHLDDPKMTGAEQRYASMLSRNRVDALIYRKSYREIGVEKGDVLTVTGYDVQKNRIYALNAKGKSVEINPQRQDYFSPAIQESRVFAIGDRVETRAIIRLPGQELNRIDNGTQGVIVAIDSLGARIRWNRDGKESDLKNDDLRFVDHAYAHTSYKEQGATNHREIVAVSKVGARVFNREAAYVAASRAKDNTELITSDLDTLLRNAGQEVGKTTAVELDRPVEGIDRKAQTGARLEPSPINEIAPSQSNEKGATVEKLQDTGNLLGF